MKLRSFLAALASLACLALALPAIADQPAAQTATKKIPKAPYYYVLDEPGVLSPEAKRSIETLLIEHDRVTGEQILVAIFKSLDGEDMVDYTNRVFSDWKIGQRGKDNGVLLALYWDDHKSRIEVGYGLEPVLTDAKSKLILTNVLGPELQNHQPDRAVSLAVLEILRTIGSPLLQNGKAATILRSGGFQGAFVSQGPAPVATNVGMWPWLFLGAILLSLAMNFLHAAEAHFTSTGWYRPHPGEYYRVRAGRGSGITGAGFGGLWWGGGGGGGGFGGGGGGFGGFMGGGGSSGGGGASGGW